MVDCRRGLWLQAQIVAGLADTPASLPSRGSEAFAAFSARMHADPALQDELAAHEDSATFIAAVLTAATARGYLFSHDDLRAAMSRPQRLECAMADLNRRNDRRDWLPIRVWEQQCAAPATLA